MKEIDIMFFGGFLLLALVFAVVWFASGKISLSGPNRSETGRSRPLEILKERYARGEIGRSEFEQMKHDLLGDSVGTK